MASRSYYEILGVQPGATDAEIRKAFRKKAKEFHPDLNKADGAAKEFTKVNKAYHALLDGKGRKPRREAPAPAAPDFPAGDVYDAFFGGTNEQKRPRKRGTRRTS
ncbi:MAG: DnaJ domain-containing protein [Dehalococcoidia bacterium]|nr:DnaJ domain-containing protein [Dehalococcoidia bacterium]